MLWQRQLVFHPAFINDVLHERLRHYGQSGWRAGVFQDAGQVRKERGNQLSLYDDKETYATSRSGGLAASETALQELRSAQVSWGNLADSEESLAKFYEDNGKPYGSTDTYHYRAQMYRRVVQALQIQIDTGVSVCSCCLKPFGSGQCTLGEADDWNYCMKLNPPAPEGASK